MSINFELVGNNYSDNIEGKDYYNLNKKYFTKYGITYKELKNKLDNFKHETIDSFSGLLDSFNRYLCNYGIEDSIGFILDIKNKDIELLYKILEKKLYKYNDNERNILLTDEYIENIKELSVVLNKIIDGTLIVDTLESEITKVNSLVISILENKFRNTEIDYEGLLNDYDIDTSDFSGLSEKEISNILFKNLDLVDGINDLIRENNM